MLEKYIAKENLKKLLSKFLKDVVLVAPVATYGEVVFQEVKSLNDIVFDFENALNAPKDWTLLNDEPLLNAEKTASRPVVIFAARPCDTKALGLLDKFFSRVFEDAVYFRKRNDVFIITLACGRLGRNCFCTSTGSGPYLESDFDIQLVDIGRGYFLEAHSSKGEDFVKKFLGFMSDINAESKRAKDDVIKCAAESKEKEFNLKTIYSSLDKGSISSKLWQDLAERCQSCGGCLLICPACSCFYVVDKKRKRLRSLDACYYEGFTRLAGGYNPISSRPEMMKRKFYHKLWQQIDEFGEPGCTGCGRCNEVCPGNVNWLETIKRIEKGLPGDVQ